MNFRRATVGLCVSLCLTAMAVAAAAETATVKPDTKKINAQVDKLVDQLNADDFKSREQAEVALVKLGTRALPQLREALKVDDIEAEVSMRIERAIDTINALAKPGGKVVNGLKYALTIDRNTLTLNKTVTLTTTIVNTTDKDLTVRVGYSTGGNYFESGTALRLLRSEDADGNKAKPEQPRAHIGFCGTGAGPINTIIKAGGAAAYKTNIRLVEADAQQNRGNAQSKYVLTTGPNQWYTLPTNGDETVQLFTALQLSAQAAASTGFHKRMGGDSPLVTNGIYWHGNIESNRVNLEIDVDGVQDAPAQVRDDVPPQVEED